jgi:hypothetical protein
VIALTAMPPESSTSVINNCFERKDTTMLWTIFVILMILWLLGFATGTTFGGLVHLLILVALVLLIYNLLTGRRIVH